MLLLPQAQIELYADADPNAILPGKAEQNKNVRGEPQPVYVLVHPRGDHKQLCVSKAQMSNSWFSLLFSMR